MLLHCSSCGGQGNCELWQKNGSSTADKRKADNTGNADKTDKAPGRVKQKRKAEVEKDKAVKTKIRTAETVSRK